MDTPRPAPPARRPGRSGQAVVFVLMALVVLAVAFLWNVDLHMLVTGKTKAQNAGDAAALAAARWQGNTLNLVGELNVMHVVALDALDDFTIDAITNMQARLCFTGPLTGLAAAQVAARKNGAKERDEFTRLMKEHAEEVLKYANPVGGAILFPEPYPGAWREYHDALLDIAKDGIVAAPDNAEFFGDVTSGHILLDKGFYDAVAGRDWCWFYLNYATGSGDSTRTILDEFTDYTFFGPIPPPNPPHYRNSEIFGVGLDIRHYRLGQTGGLEEVIRAAVEQQAGGTAAVATLSTNAFAIADNWYVYDQGDWEDYWPGMTYGDEDFLPLAGSVRDEYNYTGADAVTRLYFDVKMLSSPETKGADGEVEEDVKEIVWTAAAKPFGYIEDPNGGDKIRPNAYRLVLPSFQDVRLIPIDAASMGGDGSFDIKWREHTDEHLPAYTASGQTETDCRYCQLIKRFENQKFRQAGSDWLVKNHHLCTLPSKPGGHHGGGTRRGH